MTERLLIGLLFATIISISSYLARFLTISGSVVQFILGTILLGLGSWQWTVPMLVFFILSSFLSKFRQHHRSAVESIFEKSSRRDAWQVIANGGVAGVITLFWFFTKNDVLYIAYLGSIAAATSDTWGTEIGTLSRSSPTLITTLRRVEAGRSGAISLLGIVAGMVGSFTIWLSSLPWLSSNQYAIVLLATIFGGMIGSLADSFLGATLQIQYRCSVCDSLTERRIHCGGETQIESGLRWIENDQVNLICTLAGSLISYYFFRIFR